MACQDSPGTGACLVSKGEAVCSTLTQPTHIFHRKLQQVCFLSVLVQKQRDTCQSKSGNAPIGITEQIGSYRTEEGLQHVKGYGLQTTRRHQLRGLIVCLKQKKATGAKAGYGCCSSSSDAQSGSRIGAVKRSPNVGPTSTSSSGSWSSPSPTSGLHLPSPPGLSLLCFPVSTSVSSSSRPAPELTSGPGASFLWTADAASLTSSCTSPCSCPSRHSAYWKHALPSPSVMIEHQAEPLWMGEVRGRGVRKRWEVGGAERWKSAREQYAKKIKATGGKSKLSLCCKNTNQPGLNHFLSSLK